MNRIIHSSQVVAPYTGFGGKAEGLLYLEQNRFTTPAFYLVPDSVVKFYLEIRKLPEGLVDQWIEQFKIQESSLWAVRSSAGREDGKSQSFAGLFNTIINVSTSQIPGAIEQVINSYCEAKESVYNAADLQNSSVIIQEMIQPDYSGVAFSRNPLNSKDQSVILNIIPGLGENLVSGKELALRGEYLNTKFTWLNREDTFYGQNYSDKLVDISKSGNQIIADIQPCLTELIAGIKKLAELKEQPIDVEFAIARNKLLWLQVRPITALKETDESMVYDNSNIGENYPGISMPLTISFVQYTYDVAYTAMANYLGMSRPKLKTNKHLFQHMVGGIYGALYYNITAWQQILYQFPFGTKTSEHITRIMGMEPAVFAIPEGGRPSFFSYFNLFGKIIHAFLILEKHKKSYLQNCEEVLNTYKTDTFFTRSHEELVAIYYEMDKKLTSNWLAPVLNGFYAMLLLLVLRKVIRKTVINTKYPNFVNDILFSQGDIISVRIVRDFQKLIQDIQVNEKLNSFLKETSPAEILHRLPSEFPDFNDKMKRYLDLYGDRCDQGELKMETFNYREDPDRFISLLKSNINNHYPEHNTLENFNVGHIVAKEYRHRPIRKYLLLFLIKNTIGRIRDRENYRFIRTRVFSRVRSLFRAMDQNLFDQKHIQHKGDSLYLEHHEILNLQLRQEYGRIISSRRKEYENYGKVKHVNRYIVTRKSVVPVESHIDSNNKSVKGTGCCSGTVIGRVKIITPETIANNDFSGFIIVGKYVEPGWINLFSQASGVISEKGNLLSHTAILCRELGIPAIIGAKGGTSLIKEGDLVQMDGALGEIIILEYGK